MLSPQVLHISTSTVLHDAATDTMRFQLKPLTDTGIISGPHGLMFAHHA
jgi:hypothetical protein